MQQKSVIAFPTAWNQLEAGILFSLGVPLLVFREDNVSGGVFDNGVTDIFIQQIHKGKLTRDHAKSLREVFRKWAIKVHDHYYNKS